ncbi:DNA-formamidopyrimidine glycosylase family protein [Nakamurella deserti]|uniref:DNA-formamidopyrimidine glycosylase family protein n=1 Tax=Nakamurella deserti TaxID=2164074 RepID=UPI000DBE271A|nr:DNA-formamidopyrimidine glycosylase family protein [Nakamurella deserti]
MPEGDTVRRSAGRLHQALAGRELTRAELRWPNLGAVQLAGRTVTEVLAYGKHILTRLAPATTDAPDGDVALTLHSHLRMDGSWRVAATGPSSWPHPNRPGVRAALANAEWTAVGMTLGMLDLVATAEESTLVGHLGPDILADDFADPASPWGITEAVRRLTTDPATAIGAALLDQRNLAGIGTFYMSEALFSKGISPWTPIGDVSDPVAVVDRARRMLATNVVRATPSTTGDLRNGQRQYVHARSGQPCRRCGIPVRVAMIEVHRRSPGQTAGIERTAFYCPRCQVGPTPTDDGRAQAPLGTSGGRGGSYRKG